MVNAKFRRFNRLRGGVAALTLSMFEAVLWRWSRTTEVGGDVAVEGSDFVVSPIIEAVLLRRRKRAIAISPISMVFLLRFRGVR